MTECVPSAAGCYDTLCRAPQLYSQPTLGIPQKRLPLEDWVRKLMDTPFFGSCPEHGAVCKNAQASWRQVSRRLMAARAAEFSRLGT